MQSLKVGPNDTGPIARIAEALRRRSDQEMPSYSTMQIINACFPGTIVTGRRLPAGFKDVVRVDSRAFRTHRAPHVIVYNRTMTTAEQRHAIAHALGHIIFDGAGAACDPHDAERELRCDNFADELLVPLAEIRPFVCAWPSSDHDAQETYLDQVDLIASQFQASVAVIERQISQLVRG